MNTCAQCRFWKKVASERLLHAEVTTGWQECALANEQHGRMHLALVYADDGAVLTRSDFGCVQFEPKPIPETMPVLYAGEGEYVEPLPGHRFGPIHFKRAQPIGSAPVPRRGVP